MAFVNEGFTFVFRFVDTGGNTSTLSYGATSADYTQALLDLELARARLSALTDAVLVSYGIRDNFVEDSLVLPADAEVENKASITLQLAGGIKKANMKIPAPVDAMFVAMSGPNYNVVNPGYADLQTWVDTFAAAGFLTISDGESVADTENIVAGKRVHAASTRG